MMDEDFDIRQERFSQGENQWTEEGRGKSRSVR